MRVRPLLAAALILAVGLSMSACRLVKNEARANAGKKQVDIFFDDKSFDPDKMARDLWNPKVLPYLDAKAGDFAEVRKLLAQNPDEAGRRFGYRQPSEGSPWEIVVRLQGVVVAANTTSRAATLDVDVDGDKAADAVVQIGPVFRGTALRDSLDFVPFGSFTNQIDYAKFGRSLNTRAYDTVLANLPRDNLVGRTVKLVGVFELASPPATPLITPVRFAILEPGS